MSQPHKEWIHENTNYLMLLADFITLSVGIIDFVDMVHIHSCGISWFIMVSHGLSITTNVHLQKP